MQKVERKFNLPADVRAKLIALAGGERKMGAFVSQLIREAAAQEQMFWIPDERSGIPSDEHALFLRSPDGLFTAYVKWDGCVNYTEHSVPVTAPYYDAEQHIEGYDHWCDLDAHIARLTELRDKSQRYFTAMRDGWPG